MRRANLLISSAVALALGLPMAATAADTGPYIGAMVGYSSIDVAKSDWDAAALDAFSSVGGTLNSTSLSKNGTAFGVTIGYDYLPNLGIELSYIDLGKAKGSADGTAPSAGGTVALHIDGTFKSHGPALALTGVLPFGQGWTADARVGVFYGDTAIDLTASSNGVSASASESKSTASFMGGVGVGYAFNPNWSVRLDYLYFNKVGDENTTGQADVNVVSLGLRYVFR